MAPRDVPLTGVERFFDNDEVIVSKTDLKGRITYANRVFQRVAGYTESELMGAPHSIVRHPDMPRCVFKLLWDTLGAGQEIFAYVVNRAKNGDHYWVFAHVTPSYDVNGQLIGYHSSRRVPERAAIDKVVPLYRTLLDIENKHADRKQGMNDAFAAVVALLTEKGIGYDEFVFSL
ncbi:PAS domain-containing protein [Azospirillum rugosum]|uniref:PAS domain S-box-containing protein n=1 Tax=Azospirillum rugosum TaxID=416170 RepID=A0ABS4SPQ7_9PROT|nr:PAS domain-containing protein [Azospirillum rugosum]MBP2294098.1 PAS domain S-box-containing protein [Azospirillum rugosum]MDQ0527513.1 PAS domain S-box-containing protein [Azospirillum rugosum]